MTITKHISDAGHIDTYVYGGVAVSVPAGTPIVFDEPPYKAQADHFAERLAALRPALATA